MNLKNEQCVVVLVPHRYPARAWSCYSLADAADVAFSDLCSDGYRSEDEWLDYFGVTLDALRGRTLAEEQCHAILGYDCAALDVWHAGNVHQLLAHAARVGGCVLHGDPRRTSVALRECWELGLILPVGAEHYYADPRRDDLPTAWRLPHAQEVSQ